MKVRAVVIGILLIGSVFMIMNTMNHRVRAQTSLTNDKPVTDGAPIPDDYEFDVLGTSHAVVGVRPLAGDDFDLEVFTDTTYTTLIESSASVGDMVDFVVLDKTVWASPPNRGARITSGSTSYVIEMENDVDDHSIIDTWSGVMGVSPGNPVLDLGPSGSWDDAYVSQPKVLYDGTTYHMWYGGHGSNVRIGYATSPDGITWTKYASNPVLDLGSPGSWEDYNVHYPTVIYNGTAYQMWYSGRHDANYRIGYATSPDGVTWTKYASNPVLDLGPPGSWEDSSVAQASVLYDGTTYKMWYSGVDSGGYGRTGYATSPDGITWTRYVSNPVLDLGSPGSWDDFRAYSPEILYDGTMYHMWYTGNDGSNYRIGYATSPDGITWTKSTANPVLDLGPSGSWDDVHVTAPTVLYDGTTYHMWYPGYDGSNYRIGYATSPDGITWTKLQSNAEVLDACEITGITTGSTYTITLDVPLTADLDLFIISTTCGRNDVVASSTNMGAGFDETIRFTAPTTCDYLLVITNEDSGIGPYTVFPNRPPIADAGEDQIVFEGGVVELDASDSYDPDGTVETYEWDFDNDGIFDTVSTSASIP